MKAESSSESDNVVPFAKNAALISSLVKKPSASVSAEVKKS
jgi:hypothetical protein